MASLNTIQNGDIVEVSKKDRRFHALVMGKHNGTLELKPLDRRINYYSATAREILVHWRKTKNVAPGA